MQDRLGISFVDTFVIFFCVHLKRQHHHPQGRRQQSHEQQQHLLFIGAQQRRRSRPFPGSTTANEKSTTTMAKITTTTRTGVEYSGDVGACDFEATAEGDGVTGRAAGAPVRTVTPPAAVTAASAAAEGKSEVEPALEGNSAAERKGTETTDTMNTEGNTRASKDTARLATQRPVTPPEAVAVAAAAAKLQLKARGSPTSSRRSSSASSFSTYRSLLAMPALDALKRRGESDAFPGGDAGVFPAASTASSNAGSRVSSFGCSRKNTNSGTSAEGRANNSGGGGGGGGEGNGDSSGHQRGGESGGAGGILRNSDSATQWKSFDSATSEVSLRKVNERSF